MSKALLVTDREAGGERPRVLWWVEATLGTRAGTAGASTCFASSLSSFQPPDPIEYALLEIHFPDALQMRRRCKAMLGSVEGTA